MIKYWLCIIFFLPGFLVAQKELPIPVSISPDIHFQAIDGFGASDAWRTQFVGKNWPLEKRNKIADLLFSKETDDYGNPKGIGLSIWRFYISAGTTEQGDSSGIGNPWRRGECFLNPDGTYDWSKQQGQQWFLEAAKERGVEKLLAFPNAPPVYLSNNGKGYATKGDIHLNVKSGKMEAYAEFLVDVITHFNEEGTFFDYLSPVNEPQWNWDDAGQEGTPALNEEIYILVKYLSEELSKNKLETRIIIGEAGTIGHAVMPMSSMGQESNGRDDQVRFFFSKSSPFYIGDFPNVENTISAHSYFSVWPIENQVEYRNLVGETITNINPELGYWQSEYCILQRSEEIGSGGGRDLGMPTALYVARIIHNDMTICNAKSWQWWTALSQFDYKDGLVYLDDGSQGNTGKMGSNVESLQYDGAVRDSKLLWVLGNYSRFISPGMVRVKCDLPEDQTSQEGLLVSAYSDDEKTVYVFTNLAYGISRISLGSNKQVKVYSTDKSKNLQFSNQPANDILIPERSVVTVVD